jgi:hypothetical protein
MDDLADYLDIAVVSHNAGCRLQSATPRLRDISIDAMMTLVLTGGGKTKRGIRTREIYRSNVDPSIRLM